MAQLDFAALPVGEDDRLVGILTNRDIAIRIVAEAGDPETITVRQAMSTDVLYCFAEENVEEVLEKMDSWWVRRLPVVSQDKRLLGIVSLGELAPAKARPQDFGRGAAF
jgi:CBS domain-containing protein